MISEILDRDWGTSPAEPNAHRSSSISNVSLLVRYLFFFYHPCVFKSPSSDGLALVIYVTPGPSFLKTHTAQAFLVNICELQSSWNTCYITNGNYISNNAEYRRGTRFGRFLPNVALAKHGTTKYLKQEHLSFISTSISQHSFDFTPSVCPCCIPHLQKPKQFAIVNVYILISSTITCCAVNVTC